MLPFFASIAEAFLFPDGDTEFEGIDEPLSCGEGFGAVGCADCDGDADIAQFQRSDTMENADFNNWKSLSDFGFELLQGLPGHFVVGRVFQGLRLNSPREFADSTEEDDHCACGITSHVFGQGVKIKGLIGQFNHRFGLGILSRASRAVLDERLFELPGPGFSRR